MWPTRFAHTFYTFKSSQGETHTYFEVYKIAPTNDVVDRVCHSSRGRIPGVLSRIHTRDKARRLVRASTIVSHCGLDHLYPTLECESPILRPEVGAEYCKSWVLSTGISPMEPNSQIDSLHKTVRDAATFRYGNCSYFSWHGLEPSTRCRRSKWVKDVIDMRSLMTTCSCFSHFTFLEGCRKAPWSFPFVDSNVPLEFVNSIQIGK